MARPRKFYRHPPREFHHTDDRDDESDTEPEDDAQSTSYLDIVRRAIKFAVPRRRKVIKRDISGLDANSERTPRAAEEASTQHTNSIQVAQQETQPEPLATSYLDIDATNPFARPGDDGTTGEGRDDPYGDDFFASSLPSPPSDPSHKRRLWDTISSVLRPPVGRSVQLQERLKQRFFPQRAPSNSPVQAPENNKSITPIPEERVSAGNEDEGRDDVSYSTDNTLSTITQDNDEGKREGSLVDSEEPPPDDPSPPAKSCSNNNRTPWKFLMRALENNNKKASAMTVEVYAIRVPEVFVALPTSGPSQCLWNKFLDKLCYPCGHYPEEED